MANAHPALRRFVPALAATAAVLSSLALTASAHALQCPKGYVGAHTSKGTKCVQQAEAKPKKDKKPKPDTIHRTCGGEPCGSTTSKQILSDSDNVPSKADKAKKKADDDKKAADAAAKRKADDERKAADAAAKRKADDDRKAADAAARKKADDDRKAADAAAKAKPTDRMSNSASDNVPDPADPKRKKPALANSGDNNIPDPKSNTTEPKDSEPKDKEPKDRGSKVTTRGDTDAGADKPAKPETRASGGDDGSSQKRKAARPASTASISAPSGGGDGGSFMHNNSRMSVAASGNELTIAYDRPRDGLADLGIKPGTTLFKGTRAGNTVTGEATTFTRRCGTRTFAVSGKQSNDGKRYELSGTKPLLDGNCNVTGTSNEVLVFAADN